MTVKGFLLLIIGAVPLCGCATRVFIESPDLLERSVQGGQIVEAMLIGPRVPDWSSCAVYGCVPRAKRDREHLVEVRERLGVVQVASDDLPRVVLAPAISRPDSFDIGSGREMNWEFHTVVRLDSGRRIRVIGSDDNGLSPGDRVRVSFGSTLGEDQQEQVTLTRQ